MGISKQTKKYLKAIVPVLVVILGIDGISRITFSDLGIDFSLAIKYVDHNSPLTTIHLCVKQNLTSVFV